MGLTYLLSLQCTRQRPLIVVFFALSGEISPHLAYLVFSIVHLPYFGLRREILHALYVLHGFCMF